MNLLLLLAGLAAVIFILRVSLRARPGIDFAAAQAALQSGQAVLVDVHSDPGSNGGPSFSHRREYISCQTQK